ncbi:hypothetical protein GT347_13835 [Xylophilus rhododendri]|uniref:Uncharacterized protein n=1 Tax=Xylophilus rhododendri TaxID=2697032 RepID=A0A857J6V1_9BURK|nr:hypothetical protein [Xylophilus rhododendri]QHI98973.1 hypothetical protein GT347_13835 [Xylophilus rhododendri]
MALFPTTPANTSTFAYAPVVWHLPYQGARPPEVEILQHPQLPLDLPRLPADRQAHAATLTRIFTMPDSTTATTTATTTTRITTDTTTLSETSTSTQATTTTEPDLFQLPIEGRPVSQWIADFGNVTWHRTPDDPAPETLRARVVDGLGGKRSDRGRAVSGQFSMLHAYLRDLKKMRDQYLGTAAGSRELIENEADRLMRNATLQMAEGGGVGDAMADLGFVIEPQLGSASKAENAPRPTRNGWPGATPTNRPSTSRITGSSAISSRPASAPAGW